jgi:hypothetical protein
MLHNTIERYAYRCGNGCKQSYGIAGEYSHHVHWLDAGYAIEIADHVWGNAESGLLGLSLDLRRAMGLSFDVHYRYKLPNSPGFSRLGIDIVMIWKFLHACQGTGRWDGKKWLKLLKLNRCVKNAWEVGVQR